MSVKKYVGMLLLIIGILLLVSGWVSTGKMESEPETDVVVKDAAVSVETMSEKIRLVVNLPASGSFAGSPLLVRGRVYNGAGYKVGLQLLTDAGEVVKETVTEVKDDKVGNQQVGLWQTSLVFDNPEKERGWLRVWLLGDDGIIVEELKIPLLLKVL
jgi:hypothetical protein